MFGHLEMAKRNDGRNIGLGAVDQPAIERLIDIGEGNRDRDRAEGFEGQ